MKNKIISILISVSIMLAIFNCTTEPYPPLTNGYIHLDKTFIDMEKLPILNVSSQPTMVTLTNAGKGYLLFKFDDTDITDTFSYSSTCTGILDINDTCNIFFQFTPNRNGVYDKSFKVVNLATNDTSNINLKGEAVTNKFNPVDIPELTINSSEMNFPKQTVNSRSYTKDIEIRNITEDNITLSYRLTNDNNAFSMRSTCINNDYLSPTKTCKLSITFVPSNKGIYNSTLVIHKSDKTVEIPITGEGVNQTVYTQQTGILDFEISSYTLNYYETNLDNSSNTQYITFTNNTGRDIGLQYIEPDEEAFSIREIGTNCDIDIVSKVITIRSANLFCKLAIDFKPTRTLDYNSKIDFKYLDKTLSVKLKGRGQSVSTGAIFGYIIPTYFNNETKFYKQAVYLNNTPYAVKIMSIALEDKTAFFLPDSECDNKTIESYESCTINVGFYVDPSEQPEAYTDKIIITSSAGERLTLNVSGSTSSDNSSSISKYDVPPLINTDIDIMTSSATIGQKIYFYGGKFTDASRASLLQYYDHSNNSVVSLNPTGADMVRALGKNIDGFISSVNMMEYDGKLIFYGGILKINHTGRPLDPTKPADLTQYSTERDDNIYVYNPSSRKLSQDGAWEVVKAEDNGFIPKMMVGATSTIYNDKIYFFGGKNYDETAIDNSNMFKTYDLRTNEWENITPKITNLDDTYLNYIFSTSTVFNDTLYIYGGTVNADVFTDYNLNMYALELSNSAETTVGNIYKFTPSNDMTGSESTCLYEGNNIPVTERGPCRPYRLKMVNGVNSIFTTTGMKNMEEADINSPWVFKPNGRQGGHWEDLTTKFGIGISQKYGVLTSIDGIIASIGGGKLYLFYLD